MKKIFYLFSLLFLLNGCVESVALLGSTAGGASSSKLLQSSLKSSISYEIKKHTEKTTLGHAIAYNEKHNTEKKKRTIITFIEKKKTKLYTNTKTKKNITKKTIKKKIKSLRTLWVKRKRSKENTSKLQSQSKK